MFTTFSISLPLPLLLRPGLRFGEPALAPSAEGGMVPSEAPVSEKSITAVRSNALLLLSHRNSGPRILAGVVPEGTMSRQQVATS